jgi:sulfate transport system substrate-binding protein
MLSIRRIRRPVPAPSIPSGARRHGRAVTVAAGTAALAAATLLGTALGAGPASAAGGNLTLVAYSTPKPAYAALITAFKATAAGSGANFSQSYGPSGTQATAVVNGLPADVVNFSLQPDMDKLVKAGLVKASWDKNKTKGMVTDSIVSFVVRKDNPKHIATWADLIKPGVTVITPNPFSSGSAKWNLLAAYGAQLAQGKSKAQALSYLHQLLAHTVAQPASASSALQTFLAGEGDVLLDYEDDANYAVRQGEPVTVLTPPQTILIENPIAVTTNSSDPQAAKAFVSFLLSPAGQKVWGQEGYRPVIPSVAAQFHFPAPQKLFTIASLGGWPSADAKFFTPGSGLVAQAEQGGG